MPIWAEKGNADVFACLMVASQLLHHGCCCTTHDPVSCVRVRSSCQVEVWSCAHLRRLPRHATCATPWVPYIHLILSHALQLEIVGKKVEVTLLRRAGEPEAKSTSPRVPAIAAYAHVFA